MKQMIVMAMIMSSHFVAHMKAGSHFGFIPRMQISKKKLKDNKFFISVNLVY